MTKSPIDEIRSDSLCSVEPSLARLSMLGGKSLVVSGGTGFLGTWIAEVVAALNDVHKLGIELRLLGRSPEQWQAKVPHLASRPDIAVSQVDVRSPFDLPPETNFVINAAGIPDNRIHASDALRVYHTSVLGTNNILDAAAKLSRLDHFLQVSTGLLSSAAEGGTRFSEECIAQTDPGSFQNIYAESKRSAESLCTTYRNTFRLPISVVRPFTFIGPYQALDRPWALNEFIRDALLRAAIRIHGDGSPRRSFLYGSDAAVWLLVALTGEKAGACYNIGSSEVFTLMEVARKIAASIGTNVQIQSRTLSTPSQRNIDFCPDTRRIVTDFNVSEQIKFQDSLERTLYWYRLENK